MDDGQHVDDGFGRNAGHCRAPNVLYRWHEGGRQGELEGCPLPLEACSPTRVKGDPADGIVLHHDEGYASTPGTMTARDNLPRVA